MESTNPKRPLASSNIPKPSRLPVRSASRKRTAAEAQLSAGEEIQVAPPTKRAATTAARTAVRAATTSGVRAVSTTRSTAMAVKGKTKSQPARPVPSVKKPATAAQTAVARRTIAGSKTAVARRTGAGSKSKVVGLRTQGSGTGRTGNVKPKLQIVEEQLSETKTLLANCEHNLEAAEKSKASLQKAFDEIEANLASECQENASLKSTVSQMVADAAVVQCQLEAVKLARDKLLQESQSKSERIGELEKEVRELQTSLSQCQKEIRENESTRRKLHNIIQELKGNIRVFCRVRPQLPCELSTTSSALDDSTASTDTTSSSCSAGSVTAPRSGSVINFPDREKDARKISIHVFPPKDGPTSRTSARSQHYEFEYDRVFGPECCQDTVFSEISQLVQSALDGFNVCIFAYGQTGSGKTYTMEGPVDADEQTQGMIPRAMKQVFHASQALAEKGWVYKMTATFVEIYNETLHNLLATGKKEEKHEIRIDPKNQGEVYVTNLTPVVITSEKQVSHLLEVAAKKRVVAATVCNDRSSRSHCVFQLTLSGSNSKTMETCHGTLNLVDLAGSERLGNGGNGENASERLKETQNINKSLSNLGNVIMALANRDQHVPYRNSKLTYLLQNSLGGNSKTLMFVNLSPQPTALQETLCSLRFAAKVNQCHIGTARKTAKK